MDSPDWISILSNRLGQCLASGYGGISLDFVFDVFEDHWHTVSALPPGHDPEAYAATGVTLISALKALHPGALVMFNGITVDKVRAHTLAKLEVADMSYFEFFFSSSDRLRAAAQMLEDLGIALDVTVARNRKMAIIPAPPFNRDEPDPIAATTLALHGHEVRLSSFAQYLLVSNPNLFFYVELNSLGPYQTVTLLPEWKVPLGQARIARPTSAQLIAPGTLPAGIARRDFENGIVLVNLTAGPIAGVELPRAAYRLRISGGFDPSSAPYAEEVVPDAWRALFDGGADYDLVSTVDLDRMQGAILLTELP
jgi:hypothetical protein